MYCVVLNAPLWFKNVDNWKYYLITFLLNAVSNEEHSKITPNQSQFQYSIIHPCNQQLQTVSHTFFFPLKWGCNTIKTIKNNKQNVKTEIIELFIFHISLYDEIVQSTYQLWIISTFVFSHFTKFVLKCELLSNLCFHISQNLYWNVNYY